MSMVEAYRDTRSNWHCRELAGRKGEKMPNAVSMTAKPSGLAVAEIRPLDGALGAEVMGLDLEGIGPGPALDFLKTAYLRHHVIFLRGQKISNETMLAIASGFGEVQRHLNYREGDRQLPAIHDVTNLDANGKPSDNPRNNENYYWHSDKAYLPNPALLTMLYGIEVPPSGGNTEFADMTRAYESLDAETKRTIDRLKVVHSWRHMRRTLSNRPLTDEETRAFPDVVHPLVRVHPETGEKNLFLGMYAAEIVGMPDAEGRQLLDSLLEHASQQKFIYAHQWQPGDVVMWDNRCLLHRAVANFDRAAHRRILRRIVVQGAAA